MLFYCSGDHRDLHSFPTRRSSDLDGFEFLHCVPGEGLEYVNWSIVDCTFDIEQPEALHYVDQGNGLRLVGVDRKSTRLNSSHGYISYAVFCLKKKIALSDRIWLVA